MNEEYYQQTREGVEEGGSGTVLRKGKALSLATKMERTVLITAIKAHGLEEFRGNELFAQSCSWERGAKRKEGKTRGRWCGCGRNEGTAKGG